VGDERCVPPDDERSNYRLAKAALLDRLEDAPAAVHRIQGELGRDEGSVEYRLELADVGTFDLVCSGSAPTATSPRSSRSSPAST
jgi:6-phosphogluconolactonase